MRAAFLFTMMALLVGCASIPESINEVRAGMDKDEVLNKVGSPKFTFRENGQDHWAYFYFSNDQEWRRDIVFENGKVIRVTKPLSKNKWQKAIESSQSFEEYERNVRELQRVSSSFIPLDESP